MTDTPAPDERWFAPLSIGDPGSLLAGRGEMAVGTEGLAWRRAGRTERRRHADISGIRLGRQHLQGVCHAGCVLRFSDGTAVQVRNTSPAGMTDTDIEDAYRRFVLALHEALPAHDARRIRFLRGASEGRHRVARVVASALVTGAVGLFGWLILRNLAEARVPWLDLLGVAAGAAVFLGVLVRHVEETRPGRYDPKRLPPDLLP